MRLINLIIIVFVLLLTSFAVNAKGYDLYVNDSASSGGDGSKSDPFRTIGEAIDEAKKGEEIYVEKGEYKENVSLKNSVKLYGESENDTIIIGRITMSDGSHIENLTVKGVNTTVVIEGDASVEIENCTIRDFNRIGVDMTPGGRKVTISGTKIKSGGGKGIYIERGREVNIFNNQVIGNAEEGIDVRSKVDGKIKNNVIHDNGESGIEVIIGSANLEISDNNIKDNGASGIAMQFYPSLTGRGRLFIFGNTIGSNKKFGIDCRIPQGGRPESDYWSNAVDLRGNNIYSNKEEAISSYCDISRLIDEDEEKQNIVVESDIEQEDGEEKDEVLEDEQKEIDAIKEMEKRKEEERRSEMEEVRKMVTWEEDVVESVSSMVEKVENSNKIIISIVGVDEEQLKNLSVILDNAERQIEKIESSLSDLHPSEADEIILEEKVRNAKEKIQQQKDVLEKERENLGIWGWVKKFFNS